MRVPRRVGVSVSHSVPVRLWLIPFPVTVCSTVTRLVAGTPRIVCEACYQVTLPEDAAAALAAVSTVSQPRCVLCGVNVDGGTPIDMLTQHPLDSSLECLMCGSIGARMNIDLGAGVCDVCRLENVRLQGLAGALRCVRSGCLLVRACVRLCARFRIMLQSVLPPAVETSTGH